MTGAMINLFDLVRQAQGGTTVDLFARQFGLAPDQVRRAMEALMPAFAMGLERNAAANPAGFAEFLRAGHPMLAFFQAPAQGFPAQAFTPQAMAQGDALLGPLFGSAQVSEAVVRQAAAMTGVSGPVLKQMLPVLAGLVVAGLVHAALNQDYAQQFARFTAAMQGRPAPQPAEPSMPDLFSLMLGRPAAPPPPPAPPSAFETMDQLFEAGREVQEQYLRTLQSTFDAVWGPSKKS
jgi:hypothetical protein